MKEPQPLDDLIAEFRDHGLKPIHPRWLRALDGEASIDEVAAERRGLDGDEEIASLSALCRPIDDLAMERMIRAAEGAAPPRRRPFMRRLPTVAAGLLGAAVVLLMVRNEPKPPDAIEADVTASPALRGDPKGSSSMLVVDGNTGFYLRCAPRSESPAFQIQTVRARRGAGGDELRLGFKPSSASPPGDEIYVTADLPRGTWTVTCGVVLEDSKRFVWLDPPATVVIR